MNKSTILNMGFPVPVSGLTSYYKLDETSGTTVNDSIGSYDLTVVGSVNADGKIGRGVLLETGGERRLYTNDTIGNYQRTDTFTHSIWFKRTQAGNIVRGLTYRQNRDGGCFYGYGWVINTNNTLYFEFGDGALGCGGDYFVQSTTNAIPTTLNEWVHLVMTYNGNSQASGVVYYVNGVAVAMTTTRARTLAQSTTFTGKPFKFGVYGFANEYSSGGVLDECGIWNRALSATEVTRLYNGGRGKTY